MADDVHYQAAINLGMRPSYINLFVKLFNYRERCQDRLAHLLMLPSDYIRYNQLIVDYFVSGTLTYAEFFSQLYLQLLLPNPNHAHLCVYWVDYDRFINQGINVMNSALFTYPIVICAYLGHPIATDDLAEMTDLLIKLWKEIPEQSQTLFPQQILYWQYASQQELARHEDYYRQHRQELARQQELAREQEIARQHQMAWQQEMNRQQEMAGQQYIDRQQELAMQQALDEEE